MNLLDETKSAISQSEHSTLVILKTLEMWAQKGYELFQPIAQRFHGDGR